MPVSGTAQKRPNTGPANFEVGKYELRDVYLVKVTSLNDTAIDVTAAPGLPRFFDEHPQQPRMRVRRYGRVERVGPGQLAWDVEVIYTTPEYKEGGRGSDSGGGTGTEVPGQHDDPTQELPTIKFTTTRREVLITQVVDSVTGILKPPTNSNGEIIDPPPKRMKTFVKLEISRNEPINAAHPALGIAYVDAVNSDTFWGMSAGVWQCLEITAERQVRQLQGSTVPFLKVTYQFEGTDTWDILLLDNGSYYWQRDPSLVTRPARKRTFQTTEGHPTNGPLNGSGDALLQNIVVTFSTGSNLVTITGSGGLQVSNGDIVQFKNIGGNLPTAGAILGPDVFPGVPYYVISSAGTTFQISKTLGGSPVTFNSAGTPTSYVNQPAVYNTIRPYPRKAFAALGLPQAFTDPIQ